MRTERARLSLYDNLDMVLDKLARSTFKNPLFILPVDDFDLNPPACVGFLRLLRMMSVPRLFTLVLGDVHVAETVFNLKLSNSLAEVVDSVKTTELLSPRPLSGAGVTHAYLAADRPYPVTVTGSSLGALNAGYATLLPRNR